MFALQGCSCRTNSTLGPRPERALPTLQLKSGITRTFSSIWSARVGQTDGVAHILGLGGSGSGKNSRAPVPDRYVLGREQN